MCSECHCYPHFAGCPNAPEPMSVGTCEHCGHPIIVGEEYVEDMKLRLYHKDCVDDMLFDEIASRFGIEVMVANG